jgi:hypothetical protein
MQLHFTVPELNMLVDIFLEQQRWSHSSSGPQQAGKQAVRASQPTEDLADKILAGDLHLDFDQLEELVDLATAYSHRLSEQIASTEDIFVKEDLQQRRSMAENILEKLNETCAMF